MGKKNTEGNNKTNLKKFFCTCTVIALLLNLSYEYDWVPSSVNSSELKDKTGVLPSSCLHCLTKCTAMKPSVNVCAILLNKKFCKQRWKLCWENFTRMIGLFYNLYFNHFSESRSQMRCRRLPLLLKPFLQQHPKPSMRWPSPGYQPASRYKSLSETQVPGTVTSRHCDHDPLIWHDRVPLWCNCIMTLGNTLL